MLAVAALAGVEIRGVELVPGYYEGAEQLFAHLGLDEQFGGIELGDLFGWSVPDTPAIYFINNEKLQELGSHLLEKILTLAVGSIVVTLVRLPMSDASGRPLPRSNRAAGAWGALRHPVQHRVMMSDWSPRTLTYSDCMSEACTVSWGRYAKYPYHVYTVS